MTKSPTPILNSHWRNTHKRSQFHWNNKCRNDKISYPRILNSHWRNTHKCRQFHWNNKCRNDKISYPNSEQSPTLILNNLWTSKQKCSHSQTDDSQAHCSIFGFRSMNSDIMAYSRLKSGHLWQSPRFSAEGIIIYVLAVRPLHNKTALRRKEGMLPQRHPHGQWRHHRCWGCCCLAAQAEHLEAEVVGPGQGAGTTETHTKYAAIWKEASNPKARINAVQNKVYPAYHYVDKIHTGTSNRCFCFKMPHCIWHNICK